VTATRRLAEWLTFTAVSASRAACRARAPCVDKLNTRCPCPQCQSPLDSGGRGRPAGPPHAVLGQCEGARMLRDFRGSTGEVSQKHSGWFRSSVACLPGHAHRGSRMVSKALRHRLICSELGLQRRYGYREGSGCHWKTAHCTVLHCVHAACMFYSRPRRRQKSRSRRSAPRLRQRQRPHAKVGSEISNGVQCDRIPASPPVAGCVAVAVALLRC
jgi:hypothetical protein